MQASIRHGMRWNVRHKVPTFNILFRFVLSFNRLVLKKIHRHRTLKAPQNEFCWFANISNNVPVLKSSLWCRNIVVGRWHCAFWKNPPRATQDKTPDVKRKTQSNRNEWKNLSARRLDEVGIVRRKRGKKRIWFATKKIAISMLLWDSSHVTVFLYLFLFSSEVEWTET